MSQEPTLENLAGLGAGVLGLRSGSETCRIGDAILILALDWSEFTDDVLQDIARGFLGFTKPEQVL